MSLISGSRELDKHLIYSENISFEQYMGNSKKVKAEQEMLLNKDLCTTKTTVAITTFTRPHL